MLWIATTRRPGQSYVNALAAKPVQIDLPRALKQHEAYCHALENMGIRVITLAADERFPDGCYVEDALIARNGVALLTRSGAPSRQGEGESLRPTLEAHGLRIAQIQPPGTLDGGDVIWVDDEAYIGLSSRSNREGIAQLAAALGVRAHGVPMPPGLLHLKSGGVYLGGGKLLAVAALASFAAERGLEWVPVPEGEEIAADTLIVGSHALVPGGHPKTAALLENLGFRAQSVNLSEFHKTDGGATCLSVIWPESHHKDTKARRE